MKKYEPQYYKNKAKERYEYHKRIGLCPCGERAVPGKVRCIGCEQKYIAREMIRRQNMTEEQRIERREYMRKYCNTPEHRKRREQYGIATKGDSNEQIE